MSGSVRRNELCGQPLRGPEIATAPSPFRLLLITYDRFQMVSAPPPMMTPEHGVAVVTRGMRDASAIPDFDSIDTRVTTSNFFVSLPNTLQSSACALRCGTPLLLGAMAITGVPPSILAAAPRLADLAVRR